MMHSDHPISVELLDPRTIPELAQFPHADNHRCPCRHGTDVFKRYPFKFGVFVADFEKLLSGCLENHCCTLVLLWLSTCRTKYRVQYPGISSEAADPLISCEQLAYDAMLDILSRRDVTKNEALVYKHFFNMYGMLLANCSYINVTSDSDDDSISDCESTESVEDMIDADSSDDSLELEFCDEI